MVGERETVAAIEGKLPYGIGRVQRWTRVGKECWHNRSFSIKQYLIDWLPDITTTDNNVCPNNKK